MGKWEISSHFALRCSVMEMLGNSPRRVACFSLWPVPIGTCLPFHCYGTDTYTTSDISKTNVFSHISLRGDPPSPHFVRGQKSMFQLEQTLAMEGLRGEAAFKLAKMLILAVLNF